MKTGKAPLRSFSDLMQFYDLKRPATGGKKEEGRQRDDPQRVKEEASKKDQPQAAEDDKPKVGEPHPESQTQPTAEGSPAVPESGAGPENAAIPETPAVPENAVPVAECPRRKVASDSPSRYGGDRGRPSESSESNRGVRRESAISSLPAFNHRIAGEAFLVHAPEGLQIRLRLTGD